MTQQNARSSPEAGDDAVDDQLPSVQLETFAQSIIAHLNARVGRSFKADGPNLRRHLGELISAGVSLEQAYAVIDAKCAEWTQPHVAVKMASQLKPSVLLRPDNFRRYLENDVGTGAPPVGGRAPGYDLMAALDRRRAAGELL